MTCSRNSERMMEFFDGTSNDIEIAQLKQHLRTCKKCSEEFQSFKEIMGCLESGTMVEPPHDFEKNVMEKVNKLELSRKKHKDILLLGIYGCVTVLLSLFALVLLLNFRGFTITDIINGILLSFNSASGLMVLVYNVSQMLLNLAVFSALTIFEVVFEIFKSYSYFIAIIIGLAIIVTEYSPWAAERKKRSTKRTYR